MAEYSKIEELMIKALNRDFKSDQANAYRSRYFLAKDKLYKELLEWIRANERMLSDHSSTHIENVLKNAYKLLEPEVPNLLSDEQDKAKYSGLDLYILCMTILFHDVGNFFQREYHNQKIQTVINDLFGQFFYGESKREKNHIVTAGRAHTGKNFQGTKDTLRDVSEFEHCNGDPIQLRSIAALVRLADELAEGPQRTCQYMLDTKKITPESEVYHKYAACTHLLIDALNGRITITYDIDVGCCSDAGITLDKMDELRELFELIYERVFKLDQERKYCGYYCETLKAITETRVSFRFSNNDHELDYKLEPLVLTDLTVPGDQAKSIIEGRVDLEIDTVLNKLKAVLSEKGILTAEEKSLIVEPLHQPTEDRVKKGIFNRLFGGRK